MDIQDNLPSPLTSSPSSFNQPLIGVDFNKLMSGAKGGNLPFLAGILRADNLQKVAQGETDRVEIHLTQDLGEFLEGLKNHRAVVIETSSTDTPTFKFSRDINRLIHDHPVHEFTVALGDQKKGYFRHAVQTEKYSLEDMKALGDSHLEELAEIFEESQKSLKETEKAQQVELDKSYTNSQKKLSRMRERAQQRQTQEEKPEAEVKKEKIALFQKKGGERALFTEIVDKQERASMEAQQLKEQNAELELKREVKAQNLQKEGERLSMRNRAEL